jgi:hypothetical protein
MNRIFQARLNMLFQGSAGLHMPAGDIDIHFVSFSFC